jgi:hypothetical protein
LNSQKSTKKIIFLASIVVTVWVLLSCTFSLPSASPSGGTSGWLLPDPAAGLASLKIYHASLRQDVTGTLKGNQFERHMQIELTRAPQDGNYDFHFTLQGSTEPSVYLRVLALGQASYSWDSPDGFCHGEFDNQTEDSLIDPTLMLYPISKATKIGSETVNGIDSTHYRVDQNSLPLADPKPAANGDLWIAAQGGYVVKFTLTVQPPAKPDPEGLQAGQTWSYELSGTDGSASVALPEGCVEVLTDVPVMPDATSLIQQNGITDFVTASSAAQVIDFYNKNLPPLGWQSDQALPTGDIKLPWNASFTNGDRHLTLSLDEGDPSGVDVTIALIGQGGQGEATPTGSAPTDTPGVQPTINKSQSGLPADIPLYPGATGLSKAGSQVFQFETSDTPDQVDQYYQQQMPAQKWTLLNSTKQGVNIIQAWQKDKRVVTIAIMPQGGKTIVTIAFPNS